MCIGLKARLYTAICRNNFNFSEVERDALYREVIELIEAQEQRIAELEAMVEQQKEQLAEKDQQITALAKEKDEQVVETSKAQLLADVRGIELFEERAGIP